MHGNDGNKTYGQKHFDYTFTFMSSDETPRMGEVPKKKFHGSDPKSTPTYQESSRENSDLGHGDHTQNATRESQSTSATIKEEKS